MPEPSRQSDVIAVQLVDVLAQIESLLRHERAVEREAFRVRGVPSALSAEERRAAGTALRRKVDEMGQVCGVLCELLRDVGVAARELERLVGAAG